MSEGWVSFHRKSLESSVWAKDSYWRVWCWCLMKAAHKPTKFPFNGKDMVLEPGQFITGRTKALQELGKSITVQQYRDALTYLKETSRITIKSTNKFSIITVLNWSTYQDHREEITSKKTVKEPTKNQQRTTYNNDNNVNNNINVETLAVYDHFIAAFNKNPKLYKLTDKRKKVIALRLKDAGKDMLIEAITRIANSPWHRGQNDRGWEADLDFIIRSYEQVEKLSTMKTHSQKAPEGFHAHQLGEDID